LDVFAALLKEPISLLNSILFIYLFILQSAVQISQPWLEMLSFHHWINNPFLCI